MVAQNMALAQNRGTLEVALNNDADYITNLLNDPNNPKAYFEFESSLIELSGNAYLMEKIPADQIVRVAAQATSMGLSVNPLHKECDILPFTVKGRGVVASIVAKKKGVQEMAFKAGFFFDVDPVWAMKNGEQKAESEMTRQELTDLNPSDPAFFKKNMKGWDFTLKDISEASIKVKVPEQRTFVSLKDAIAVTGAMQATEHSLKQAYVHKAIRRAMTEFYIPRNRNSSFLKMIEVDDKQAIEVEVIASGGKVSPVTAITDGSVDDADAILEVISSANSADELKETAFSRANSNETDRRPELIKAYKAKKAELDDPAKKGKSFGVIMDEINKAKSVKAVDDATLVLSHLDEAQKTELLNAAENQKHVINS